MDDTIRKNPSRKECEKAIRRILITEILENGKNMNMYNSSINVLCEKLDDIINGAADLEPFTDLEALDY